MTRALDAFQHAVAIVYTSVGYDWSKLQTIQQSGLDVFPYGTPDETRATGKGLCREKAILACDDAFRRHVPDVRLVVGSVDADRCGHCGGDGHAWCEAHDGDLVRWGDPTNGTEIVEPAEWQAASMRYAPTTSYHYDGQGFDRAYDWTKEAA